MLNENQISDRINKSHGYIVEEVLKKTIYNGRKVIEGEVGANGIDILTYKEDKNGNITNVRPYEIKWNKSPTGTTKSGDQGSTAWLNKKMENLINVYPHEKKYQQINEYIQNNNPDTRLIRVKPIDNERVTFEMLTLQSDNDKTNKIYKLDGRTPKIAKGELNLINPKTKYETKISLIYKKKKKRILKKKFQFISDKDISVFQKNKTLNNENLIELQNIYHKSNTNKTTGGSMAIAHDTKDINPEQVEEYLQKVIEFKKNIQEINDSMNTRIYSLESEYCQDSGFDEFCSYFKEKVTNRMDNLIDEVVGNNMINKLNEHIEKLNSIKNHRIGK